LTEVSTTTGIYKNSPLLQYNRTKSLKCFETISKYVFTMCLTIEQISEQIYCSQTQPFSPSRKTSKNNCISTLNAI